MRSKTQVKNPPYKYFVKMYNLPSGISNKDVKIVKFPKSNFSSLGGDGGCPIMGIVVLWKCESHFQSRFQLLLNSVTTQSQVHRYKYTNTNTWIQMHKNNYTNTNLVKAVFQSRFQLLLNSVTTQSQTHKYTNTFTQVQIHKYSSLPKEEKYYLRKMWLLFAAVKKG